MDLGQLWNNVLGRRMTARLMKLMLPDLVWNQEIYGTLVHRHLNKDSKWLDVGCGHQILPGGLERIEDDMVARKHDSGLRKAAEPGNAASSL